MYNQVPQSKWIFLAQAIRVRLLLFHVTLALFVFQPGFSQTYQTLGYRSCGTENGSCHISDGKWWKSDPHYSTISDLKRKKKRSLEIAQSYGMNPADYLKGNSGCAKCHGEVVSGREAKNMNTGVSCELCHGSSGPKGKGYLEVHQEGSPPKDPLAVSRSGYQKALKVGLLELRNVGVRAKTCVDCHQINEKKLLETGHPSGEGFDYIKGIRNNIAKHWDYQLRPADSDNAAYAQALRAKPIPEYTVKSSGGLPANFSGGPADTVFVYVEPQLPGWLNPKKTISIKPFAPGLSQDAPVDSVLWVIKSYIEYIHQELNK